MIWFLQEPPATRHVIFIIGAQPTPMPPARVLVSRAVVRRATAEIEVGNDTCQINTVLHLSSSR